MIWSQTIKIVNRLPSSRKIRSVSGVLSAFMGVLFKMQNKATIYSVTPSNPKPADHFRSVLSSLPWNQSDTSTIKPVQNNRLPTQCSVRSFLICPIGQKLQRKLCTCMQWSSYSSSQGTPTYWSGKGKRQHQWRFLGTNAARDTQRRDAANSLLLMMRIQHRMIMNIVMTIGVLCCCFSYWFDYRDRFDHGHPRHWSFFCSSKAGDTVCYHLMLLLLMGMKYLLLKDTQMPHIFAWSWPRHGVLLFFIAGSDYGGMGGQSDWYAGRREKLLDKCAIKLILVVW